MYIVAWYEQENSDKYAPAEDFYEVFDDYRVAKERYRELEAQEDVQSVSIAGVMKSTDYSPCITPAQKRGLNNA